MSKITTAAKPRDSFHSTIVVINGQQHQASQYPNHPGVERTVNVTQIQHGSSGSPRTLDR